MFSLIYAWINDWVNNREAGDLRRQRGHYDVIVMIRSYNHQVHNWNLDVDVTQVDLANMATDSRKHFRSQ